MLTIVDILPTVVGSKFYVFLIHSKGKLNEAFGGILMNFNERLIELRKSKGLSQEELGEKISVSRQTISKWELAQSYPDFQRLILLSDFFGMPLDELVRGLDVQDVREKNLSENQLTSIFNDVNHVKNIGKLVIKWYCIITGSLIVLALLFRLIESLL